MIPGWFNDADCGRDRDVPKMGAGSSHSPEWTKVDHALQYARDLGQIHFVARATRLMIDALGKVMGQQGALE